MKKVTLIVLVALMTIALLAGCASTPVKKYEETSDKPSPTEEVSEVSTEPETSPAITSTGYPIADSYTAYITIKGEMLTNLTNGLSSNDSTAMESLSLLGVSMIDLVLLPASFFGMGKEAMEAGMGFFSATDIQYTESGNSYTVSYKNDQGQTLSLTGVWDAAADSLICTLLTDGTENLYSEYRKTSYGYVGQYFMLNDDGTTALYLVTVNGKDGAIGISSGTVKPAALTGSEPVDFPSSCDMWYAINGTTVTGKTSSGTEVNFEYVPEES